jgi:hypothetical protein
MNTWSTILWFQSWETRSVAQYVASLVGLFLLGVAHEALNSYRATYLASSVEGSGLQEPLVGVSNNPKCVLGWVLGLEYVCLVVRGPATQGVWGLGFHSGTSSGKAVSQLVRQPFRVAVPAFTLG